jgi:hypothetical protein
MDDRSTRDIVAEVIRRHIAPWLPTNPSLFIWDRRRSLAAVFLWAFGAASRILAGDPLLLSLKWTASAGVS